MRVGQKIALVGGVPILIAAAIAVAGWFLLAQEERARAGAMLASRVYHDLTVARMVRDSFVAARAPERSAHAERFGSLTAEAGSGLESLKSFARTGEQTERVASAQAALSRYVARMGDFTAVTRESDGLVAEMSQRANTLIELADRARIRQQASNADLVRSLGEKVVKLSVTRDVVAGINALRLITAEIALEKARLGGSTASSRTLQSQFGQLRSASRNLGSALRSDGRERDADELDALTASYASPSASAAESEVASGDTQAHMNVAGRSGPSLSEWGERILKIDSSDQRTLHEEVKQLLTYSVEANETEQATQNIAVSTLKLGQRTATALLRRDPTVASAMLDEGERLSAKAVSLPISPLIQGEMIDAIDGWRNRLATTIGRLKRQNEMIAEMDTLALGVSDSAKALNDAAIADADRVGAFIRQLLVFGAAGGLLLGSIVAALVARSILVPLRELQGDMIALAANPAEGAVRRTDRHDELGDIARATNFFVTEIGRRERALVSAKDKADAALLDLSQAQNDLIRAEKLASLGQLVAGVAHEINTPLGIALTTATLVRDETRAFQGVAASGQLSRSRLTHFIDRVGEGAQLLCANLTRAADLVHGFKQVAVDRVSDERRVFELASWLDDLIASLQPLLRKGGHSISHECLPGIMVDTNPGALAQVVTNLINNAVIHGFDSRRRGHIALKARAVGAGLIRIEIVDDGIGIAPENLGRIFDPFFTTARNRGSTGLGMHIVHNLVLAKLQGRIGIESIPGNGTTVRIEFPAGADAEQPALVHGQA